MLTSVVHQGLALERGRDRASERPARRRSRIPGSGPFVEAIGLVALGLLLGAPGKPKASFVVAPRYAAGPNPTSVAVGDFNSDGIPDLAVANFGAGADYSGTVSILLGNGDGTFQTAQSFPVGFGARSVAVGDFDTDGRLDLAVANYGAYPDYRGSVSILIGNGDGTFQAPQSYAAGAGPTSVAVVDFNGDGIPDLAVANDGVSPDSQGTVNVLLGKGDGTFQAARSYAVGESASYVAVGDFNGDGLPDLAVAAGTGVSILLGNGDGSFQAAHSYDAGAGARSLAVSDFNGDGHPDLAVADWESATLSILLGRGDGTFQDAHHYDAGYDADFVAVGDFNGDGYPDLVVTHGYWGSARIWLGRGDGTLQAGHTFDAGTEPVSVAVGQFTGNGFSDLAVAGPEGVTVLLGKGAGTFQAAPRYAVAIDGSFPSSLAVADFNGDGKLDLAVTNVGGFHGAVVFGPMDVLLGKGDSTFQDARSNIDGLGYYSVAVGDLNGDGIPDLAVAQSSTNPDDADGGITIFLGNGDGTFRATQSLLVGSGSGSLALGDFNGDGLPDLAVTNSGTYPLFTNGGVTVFLGKGDGTFQSGQSYDTGTYCSFVAVGDFNGDARPDLVVTNPADKTVSILVGQGDGTFRKANRFAVENNPTSVALGDFNGDGHLDIAVAGWFNMVTVLLGNGDGTFQVGRSYAVGSLYTFVAVADFNGDGILDLAVVNVAPDNKGQVSALLGKGDGSFQDPQSYAVSSPAQLVAVGDFNGDGLPDLAVSAGAGVTVLLNAADWAP